jgi:hypothetical protein
MPYTEKQVKKFPEPYGARADLVPGADSWKDSDASCEPQYIGSSADVEWGNASDDVNVRMGDPFNDAYAYDAEPKGSSPQSGEGINAPNKPEGAGLEPENPDFY